MRVGSPFSRTPVENGRALAGLLAGSWRQPPHENAALSNQLLSRLAPAVTSGGGSGLAWFRIRQSGKDLSPSVLRVYHEAYISLVATAAAHEADLERLSNALCAANIRFVLLKGWSVGRLYPESGLRPSGDIDLWIDPQQRPAAEAILRDLALTRAVDLEHDQLARFEDRGFAEFYALCDTVQLGSTAVKILRPEDQVRILCLHFLKHGGWRPLWLCDIAILLESERGTFDWKVCLGANHRREYWIGSTIALARELLEARIPAGAPYPVTSSPPKWLVGTVLWEWGDPRPPSTPAFAVLLPSLWHQPWQVKTLLRGRWRNSIQATTDCDGGFIATWPRWVYQARDAVARATRFCLKTRLLRKQIISSFTR